MSRQLLKNFCVEPTRNDCTCTRDIRCGGIILASLDCPEHGMPGPVSDVMKTHFHPIQGRAVGTDARSRYDAKAS